MPVTHLRDQHGFDENFRLMLFFDELNDEMEQRYQQENPIDDTNEMIYNRVFSLYQPHAELVGSRQLDSDESPDVATTWKTDIPPADSSSSPIPTSTMAPTITTTPPPTPTPNPEIGSLDP